jgi:acetyltransferase
MSIRNLDALLTPASVAVLGATDRASSVGATVWRNLRQGGFAGAQYPVNPRLRELDGQAVYASVDELPQAPDLAVVCTPPGTVAELVEALGRKGTRAAVVMTAGLDAAQRQAMLDAARRHLLRILGPNCIGLLTPHLGLNASFAHTSAQAGELAFVSQSGALVTAMLDWAQAQDIGFSSFVSLGEHADVDFGDLLDYLASDARTRAILLYIESVSAPRKFMSAARAAARNKPVIVVKAGRSPQGQAAAASHTGALAGSDLVYDAALARAGVLRVNTLQELFLAAQTLTRLRGAQAERITVLTNGGGAGVMAADAAFEQGVALPALQPATRARLDAALPATWSRGNPVDIIGDAPAQRYVDALRALLDEPASGTVLLLHAPTALVPSDDIAQALVPLAQDRPQRVMSCWLGGTAVAQARQTFRAAGLASFETPEDAVRGLAMLAHYRRNQAELSEAPPAHAPDRPLDVAALRAVVDGALAQGREMLTEPEAKAVLAACGIPVVPTRRVGPDPAVAVAAADALGYPVVLKIVSPDITHKSDAGGVALNLADATAVRAATQAMLARLARERPQARLEGFSVQPMLAPDHAQELIVGSMTDATFGPVILFGQGGTSVEVVADRAVALPPLNLPLARALVARTRVARLLAGWRDTPAVDEQAVHQVLVAVSQLLAAVPEIAELDINPLLANHAGVTALDARVRLSAARPAGADNFAIRPYPVQWEQNVTWRGRPLCLRPIKPDDEAMHQEFLRALDPEDIHMRVFYSRRTLARSELARLVQIDYAREMAFIAVETDTAGEQHTLGVARALADPDNVEAEFGLIVRSDLKGSGLGLLLMQQLIAYLRAQGVRRLVASVLDDNPRMLSLARELGFTEQPLGDCGEGTRGLVLQLD